MGSLVLFVTLTAVGTAAVSVFLLLVQPFLARSNCITSLLSESCICSALLRLQPLCSSVDTLSLRAPLLRRGVNYSLSKSCYACLLV